MDSVKIMTMFIQKQTLLKRPNVTLDGGRKTWITYIMILVSNTDIFISKDVSWCGWGAVMESQSAKTIFSTSEKKEHTNILEMKAFLFGLKALVKGFTKPHIKMLSDNSTAVACIKNLCTSAQGHS